MANTHRAPKQWCLSKLETVNSFENWRHNLQYTLSLDPNFAPFLVVGAQWEKKSRTSPLRGYTNDGNDVQEAQRRTAEQKVAMLELMLGQIANYCPVISRNTIVKNSTSIDNIWQIIRLHYGFQSSGAHFLDFSTIRLQPDERPEDLYQRLMAFVEDNLLLRDGGISHHGAALPEDEELSPTLENFIVLTWLRLIHPALPQLVKQRYGTELRSRTLASIKPEISQALTSLLDEIRTTEDAKVMRTATPQSKSSTTFQLPSSKFSSIKSRPQKSCPLCLQAKRPSRHFLSECSYLPDQDRKYLAKARQILNIVEQSDADTTEYSTDDETTQDGRDTSITDSNATYRIQVRQSPYLDAFYGHHTTRITIDSGATGNMIRISTAQRLGLKISKSSQSAHQADGSSPLKVVGEVDFVLVRDNREFTFSGLVVENLDVDMLGGTPFMERNDIAVRPAKREITLSDGTSYIYGSATPSVTSDSHTIRRAHLVRASAQPTTVWPGDFLELDIPDTLCQDEIYALEPRSDSPVNSKSDQLWPPLHILTSICGKIRVPNLTNEPKSVKRHEHVCQIRPVFSPATDLTFPEPQPKSKLSSAVTDHSACVSVDPDDMLSPDMKAKFLQTLREYDEVFNPEPVGYNGASGPFQSVVNMGPVLPPQRKGRLPLYSRNHLVDLQHKFDELQRVGVFTRPEDAGVTVEYLNPSFLVKKANRGSRLVTAFADVGRYSKPQPSVMPDVDSTLRQIGRWKYIITTDLSNAFYQIPLAKESMKFCGVATPFRGVLVYARSAMGMPGSETALEELMCRVLGDMLEEGTVCKLADDLYCGGQTPDELLVTWERLLQALQENRLRLSAPKTTIAPSSVSILGWIWQQGSIHASPHRIAALSSCPVPTTVRGLRSFIGAYKVLARVIPRCSSLLSPLDTLTAGCLSNDKLSWSDEHLQVFHSAQQALSTNKAIVLPHPEDQLWIVTDGSVKQHGIGATLYVTRKGKQHLAGFFSAKLRGRQITWLPCEVEALSIAVATRHFHPYIVQSCHKACILTDSKPCVQAYEKLCRGEFSASPRVSTFLSTVSRYQASIRHLAGSANIPSDFASRNAPDCTTPSCQVCSFVQQIESCAVHMCSPKDILSGVVKLPFTTRSAWLSLQSECADLRRTHAHLRQGTRPSKKLTDIKDVKRYLNTVTIAKDGLLVTRRHDPFIPTRECIVVPRQILDGLLTSLHIRLDHPSCHQLKLVMRRHFFALDMDKAVERISSSCHHCASLKSIPHHIVTQTTEDPPDGIGLTFAADVLKRERQLILVLRECVTSFTCSTFLDDEKHGTIRDALLRLSIELRPLDGPPAVIRTDNAPGFVSLVHDELLQQNRLSIELGRVKNINKNPVAERAIQELESELLNQDPLGGVVSPLQLSFATARLNSRIRGRGLSAREMWLQRDQYTNSTIPIKDGQLVLAQHTERTKNHPHSEKSKCPSGTTPKTPAIDIGDLVYVESDRNKSKSRDRYLVCAIDGNWCSLRKFAGSQLRSQAYRVKKSQCYKVPSWFSPKTDYFLADYNSVSSDDDDVPPPCPPVRPRIPDVLSIPETHTEPGLAMDCNNALNVNPVTQPFPLNDNMESPPLRRSTRQRSCPKHLQDFVLD